MASGLASELSGQDIDPQAVDLAARSLARGDLELSPGARGDTTRAMHFLSVVDRAERLGGAIHLRRLAQATKLLEAAARGNQAAACTICALDRATDEQAPVVTLYLLVADVVSGVSRNNLSPTVGACHCKHHLSFSRAAGELARSAFVA